MSFPYLDLAIGMSFIFLLLALTCTTVTEAIAGILNSRGKMLEQGIGELLQDTGLRDKLYAHPLIQGIESKSGKTSRLPSYISPNKFALALMDILTGPSAAANDVAALSAGVSALQNPATKQLLTAVLQNPKYATDEQRLEAWYNAGMDRVSGWYKRTTQIRVYVLAALITLIMNADSRKILTTLWNNPAMTSIAVESAKVEVGKGQTPEAVSAEEKKLLGQVSGWQEDSYHDWSTANGNKGLGRWIAYLLQEHLLGWLITIFAVSLGAPFWFDTLSKFMNLRNAGKPPQPNAQTGGAQTPPPAPLQSSGDGL